jgi:hypothetical protein
MGAPAWMLGPRAQTLDATGILLEFARQRLGSIAAH